MPSPRVAAVLLVVLAGCGNGMPASSERQVRAAVETWLTALRSGDDARACASLTSSLQRSITTQLRIRGEHGKCRTAAASWTGGSTPPGRPGAHVTAVRIKDGAATVGLAAPPDRTSSVRLRKQRGHWLIDNY